MKMRDIQEPMMKLLEDGVEAEGLLDEKDNQFFRRTYIRSIFASIEGTIWLIKQVCLKAKPHRGHRLIGVAEYALLTDHSYELKNNGEPSVQTKHLKLPDNLRFTVNVVQRLFGARLELGVGTTKWDNFLKTVRIRNRVTHPKTAEELTITDEEIALCKEVSSWFNDLAYAFFQGVLTTSEAVTKALSSGGTSDSIEEADQG
jgi:hypothetical protein